MFIENIKEACRNLFSNKLRSLLTMLGIIIGITAVIMITTIGTSIQKTLTATMNSLGGNSVYCYVEPIYPEDVDWDEWSAPAMRDEDQISYEMMYELVDKYPNEIFGFTGDTFYNNGQIKSSADNYANVDIVGTNEYQLEGSHLELIRGRNITSQDMQGGKKVMVVSDVFVENYFGETDPIGKQVTYTNNDGKDVTFTVIGVYRYDEKIFGKPDVNMNPKDRTTLVYVPSTMYKEIDPSAENADKGIYSFVTVLLQVGADPDLAGQEIEGFFAEKYANNSNFEVYSYNQSIDTQTINSVINAITLAISGVAGISLVVGGVGVMNIMLVSITERTREIGIRKALGAKNKTIRQQFLIESIILCLTGGVIGIVIGLVLAIVLGKVGITLLSAYYTDLAEFISMDINPSGISILISVAVSMLIGVFFGSYPAKKAAKMEVIDALKYE